MSTHMRYGNKWNINELLKLQREYELLEWSIQEIAKKHRRSVNAILFKLESEGFISCWNEARGFELLNYEEEEDEEEEEEEDEEEEEEEEEEEDDGDYEDDEEEEQNANESIIQDKYDNSVDENVSKLADRVWSLETSVSEIGTMVKQMFDYMVTKKTAKRGPLRKY